MVDVLYDLNLYSAFLFGTHDLSPLLLRLAQARLSFGSRPRQKLLTSTEGPKRGPLPKVVPETGTPFSITTRVEGRLAISYMLKKDSSDSHM